MLITHDYSLKWNCSNQPRLEHTFSGWNNNITFMPSHDLTITALWSINEYEVTIDFGNGTTMKKTFKYDEPIAYPEGINKEGYKFSGW